MQGARSLQRLQGPISTLQTTRVSWASTAGIVFSEQRVKGGVPSPSWCRGLLPWLLASPCPHILVTLLIAAVPAELGSEKPDSWGQVSQSRTLGITAKDHLCNFLSGLASSLQAQVLPSIGKEGACLLPHLLPVPGFGPVHPCYVHLVAMYLLPIVQFPCPVWWPTMGVLCLDSLCTLHSCPCQ